MYLFFICYDCGRLVRGFWLSKREKSWVHLTRKYQQIEFPMTRHHNQCFVKLSQITDNKQEPTHDHNIHSTYNANSTLPLSPCGGVFNTLTAQKTDASAF